MKCAVRSAAVGIGCLALAGCLEGERPPLWTTYGDPVSQVPAVGVPSATVTRSESRTAGTSIPGLSALGAPVATTTETTTRESVEVWAPPGTTVTSRTIYPDPDPGYRPLLPSGQPRYVYPRNDIRCDNLTRVCEVWSGPHGRYLRDVGTTRMVYGR